MKRKILILLSALIIMFAVPLIANAQIIGSGDCGAEGDNVTWTLDDEGTLTINGHGATAYMMLDESEPWYDNRNTIQSIVINDGITEINSYAFDNLLSLKSINISNSVNKIGFNVFSNCENLERINIPDSVVEIGHGAFSGCSSLKYIKLSRNITDIPYDLFKGCVSLNEVQINSKVDNIDNTAFEGCSALNIIVSEDNQNYSSINGVLFNKDKTTLIKYSKDTISPDYVIPDGTTEIASSAFDNCFSLQSVFIPASVTSIGMSTDLPAEKAYYIGAFDGGCINITVSEDNLNYSSQDGVLFNKNKTEIVAYAKDLVCPTYIVPNTVKTIGPYSFSNCRYLNVLILTNGVNKTGHCAFYGCSALKKIFLPKSLTYIETSTFGDCSLLNDIYYEGTENEWNSIDNKDYTNTTDITIHYSSPNPKTMIPAELTVKSSNEGYVVSSATIFDGIAYAAAYDAEGALISVVSEPFADGTATVAPDTAGAAKIKFFVWTNTLQPVTLAKEIALN